MKITRTSHGKRYVTTELVKPHHYLPSVGFALCCAGTDLRDTQPHFSVGLAHAPVKRTCRSDGRAPGVDHSCAHDGDANR